MKFVSEILKLT